MISGIAVIAAGMLIGLGLWWLLTTLMTPMVGLQPAIARLSPQQITLAPERAEVDSSPVGFVDEIGQWAQRHLAGRVGFTTPEKDLALLGVRPTRWWGRKVIGALIGLLFPSVISSLLVLAGGTMNLLPPAFVGLLLGLMGWLLQDLKVQRAARAARYDFAMAVAAYLQQVAILRRASFGPGDSMHSAAKISESWTFRRIQAALFRADLAHLPPWEGLDQLAEDLDVPELTSAADIMRTAGESGAGVWDSLIARSTAIRRQAMAETQGASQSATTTMSAPIAVMALVFFMGMLYPAMIQLSAI